MFKWIHEHSIVVDFPLQTVRRFHSHAGNWKLPYDIESYHQTEDELKTGSIVKAKIKNRNAYVNLVFTEVERAEYKVLLKIPFFKQENHCVFEEITPTKTKITTTAKVTSFLTPFLKSYYRKKIETQYVEFFDDMIKKLMQKDG